MIYAVIEESQVYYAGDTPEKTCIASFYSREEAERFIDDHQLYWRGCVVEVPLPSEIPY